MNILINKYISLILYNKIYNILNDSIKDHTNKLLKLIHYFELHNINIIKCDKHFIYLSNDMQILMNRICCIEHNIYGIVYNPRNCCFNLISFNNYLGISIGIIDKQSEYDNIKNFIEKFK